MEIFETGIILMSPLLNMLICAASFVVALMLEVIMLPRILLISKLKRLYDLPNARKHHRSPTLRLTGVTFFPILILSFLPLVGMQALLLNDSDFAYSSAFIFQFAFSLSGCLILVLLGIKNDLVRVRYSHKFLLQIMAACLLIASGTYIDNFQGLLGIYALPSFVVYPFNLLLIVYIINAINLINGVDGLTASLSCLAAGALGVLLLIQESYYYAPLAFAIVGMLIPLLFYSTSARRKTFMGDTGSLTLGYTLALLAVHYGSQESTMQILAMRHTPLILAWSVLFVPLFDGVRVICVRASHRKPLFSPDRNHMHHKLLALGFSHKAICVLLSLFTLVILILNLLLENWLNINLILLIDLASGVFFNFCINRETKFYASLYASETIENNQPFDNIHADGNER